MTDERMTLLELVEKGADADLVRDLLAFAAERLMAAEVEQLTGAACGARTPDRVNHRNGYRERGWETRVGRIELAIPKLRKGSYFPGAAPDRREGPDGGHPGGRSLPSGPRSGTGGSTASRPARSTTWSRRWAAPASPRARSRACARTSTSACRPSSAGRSKGAGPTSGSTRPTSSRARAAGSPASPS